MSKKFLVIPSILLAVAFMGVSPLTSVAATYGYVTVWNTLDAVNANSSVAALAAATNVHEHSGVILLSNDNMAESMSEDTVETVIEDIAEANGDAITQ